MQQIMRTQALFKKKKKNLQDQEDRQQKKKEAKKRTDSQIRFFVKSESPGVLVLHHIGEYISQYLFYFVNLTSSCLLILIYEHLLSASFWDGP